MGSVAVVSSSFRIRHNVQIASTVHVALVDSQACAAEEIHDGAGFPTARHTLDEGVSPVQGGKVVDKAGIEDVPTVEIRRPTTDPRIEGVS